LTNVRKVAILYTRATPNDEGDKEMATYAMLMDKKYINRRRVAFVIAIALAAVAVLGLYELITHIWYVQGQGYCWGTMTECFANEFGGR
jgi:hypothetical protein